MKKYGMQTVIDDKMPADLSDISATLTKVKALKPDVLVVSGHNKGPVTAARQMKELQINVPRVAIAHREGANLDQPFGARMEERRVGQEWVSQCSSRRSPYH